MNITNITLFGSKLPGSLCFGSVTFENEITVDIAVRKGREGNFFVSFPSKKGKDKDTQTDKWYDTVRFTSPEIKNEVSQIILD
jgi:DNA-binding cell septation regulator SpoVG